MNEQDNFEKCIEELVDNEFSNLSYEAIAESLEYLAMEYQRKANNRCGQLSVDIV